MGSASYDIFRCLNGAQRTSKSVEQMAGKSFGIALEPGGKYRQKLLGVSFTPLELKARLETRSKKLMKGYEAVIIELEHEPCALKCRRCNHFISPSNPSQSIKQHDGRCTGPALPEEELMEEEDPDEGAGGPP